MWSRTHEAGDMWRDGQVEIKVAFNQIFQINVEGIRGTESHYSDIALDDLSLHEERCPSDGLCDFEDGICMFMNDTLAKVPWLRDKHGNSSIGNGPEEDHTTSSEEGKGVIFSYFIILSSISFAKIYLHLPTDSEKNSSCLLISIKMCQFFAEIYRKISLFSDIF